ncbi:uncharacterized protein LOC120156964 isoform X1 [Hibiscus syriacus]|uniref:uncharacterized protein LOC120156964 isoform X1 n=1 Tax=Hibiscus syriacus TaxID=106335 RepID=UPI001920B635|nr:uncharacterized protein LOC120156964 isoform X1 [Hibiscus syriacus]
MEVKTEITANVEIGGLVNSALPRNDLVSIYAFPDSDLHHLLGAWMTREYRKTRRELDRMKRNDLSYAISQTSSRQKVIKKIAKRCAAIAVFIRRNPEENSWKWISYAGYSVHRLLQITALLGVEKGKIISEMLPFHQIQGFRFNLTPELYLDKSSTILRHADQESGSEEAESPPLPPISDVASDDNHSDKAVLLNSISIIRGELSEPCLGWPLLRRKSPANQEFKKHEGRDTSVLEWIMSLPDRVTSVVDQIDLHSNQASFNDNHKIEYGAEDSVSSNIKDAEPNPKPGWPLLRITASTTSIESQEVDNCVQIENSLPALRKMPNNLALRCKQFTLGA